jgi:hypothetical protein
MTSIRAQLLKENKGRINTSKNHYVSSEVVAKKNSNRNGLKYIGKY